MGYLHSQIFVTLNHNQKNLYSQQMLVDEYGEGWNTCNLSNEYGQSIDLNTHRSDIYHLGELVAERERLSNCYLEDRLTLGIKKIITTSIDVTQIRYNKSLGLQNNPDGSRGAPLLSVDEDIALEEIISEAFNISGDFTLNLFSNRLIRFLEEYIRPLVLNNAGWYFEASMKANYVFLKKLNVMEERGKLLYHCRFGTGMMSRPSIDEVGYNNELSV